MGPVNGNSPGVFASGARRLFPGRSSTSSGMYAKITTRCCQWRASVVQL